MQNVINSILSMDREAEACEKNMQLDFKQKREELKQQLQELEESNSRSMDELKKTITSDKLKKAEQRVEELSTEQKSIISNINHQYALVKDKIAESIFLKIINS